MRKSICLVLVFLFLLSSASYGNKMTFVDIDEIDPYYEEVQYLYNNRIIDGYGDGTFRPEKLVTTMEYIKMFLDALGYKEEINKNGYWGQNYIDLAETIGFIERGKYTRDMLNNFLVEDDLLLLTENALRFIGDDITDKDRYNFRLYQHLSSDDYNNKLDFEDPIGSEEDMTFNKLYPYNEMLFEDVSPLLLKGIVNDIFPNIHYDEVMNNSNLLINRGNACKIISRVINKDYRIKLIKEEVIVNE